MSKAFTYYLSFIDELYQMIEDRFDFEKEKKEDKEKFDKIRAKYKKISEEHGAEIKAVHYISGMSHFLIFMRMQTFRQIL
jgi:hypothetical protein